MAFTPISNEFIQYQKDASGTSASGFFIKAYAAGTSTPISLALEGDGTPLVDKVEIDSLGFAKNASGGATGVFVDQSYRLVLYANATDADNNTFASAIQDIDNLDPVLTGDLEAFVKFTDLSADNGSTLINYDQGDTNAVIRTVESKLREQIYVEDFGAVGDGVTDDYFAIKDAFDALQTAGGGTLNFGHGKTYFINQFRINPPAVDANGILTFSLNGISNVIINGNNSTIKHRGGWTRRANNGAASLDNSVMIQFILCNNVTMNDLEVYGGSETITQEATLEGGSYGIQVLGCEDVNMRNVYSHHHLTDGILFTYFATGVGFEARSSKRILLENCRFWNNARQGMTLNESRGATFIRCSFNETGQTGLYGTHSPVAGVDIEPEFFPGSAPGVVELDVETGDFNFYGCDFKENIGSPFIATSDTKVKEPVRLDGCTFADETEVSTAPRVISAVKNLKISNSTFIEIESAPGFTFNTENTTELFGCTFFNSRPALRSLASVAAANPNINVDNCVFNFTSPTERTAFGIHLTGNMKAKFTNNVINIDATEHDGVTSHTHSILTTIGTLSENEWNTDLTTAGLLFQISMSSSNVHNDKFSDPTFINRSTTAGITPNVSLGAVGLDTLQYLSGETLTFLTAAPVSGTHEQGSIVFNRNAVAGGKVGFVCVASGTPGTWKAFGVIDP